MTKFPFYIILSVCLVSLSFSSFSQQDSNKIARDTSKDFVAIDSLQKVATTLQQDQKTKDVLANHSPRKAAMRSLILPGWGQAYNKKYWKIPIVWGGLGIAGGIFNYNLQWYRRTRYAYRVLVNEETQNYPKVHKQLQVFITRNDPGALQSYRDEFRRNICVYL